MNVPVDSVVPVDRALLKRHLRQARQKSEGDFLAREMEGRMQESLDYIRLAPQRILALECAADLGARYPAAACLEIRRQDAPLVAAVENLPLPAASVDLIWANHFEFWRHDLARTLQEALRVLRPGGLLMLSTFGPDTLKELRAGLEVPALPTIDLRALGDLLLRVGFADPVTHTESLTLAYARLGTLFADLRAVAPDLFFPARCENAQRSRWQKLLTRYEHCRAERQDGKFPAHLEILHAHAWALADGDTRQRRESVSGQNVVPLRHEPLKSAPLPRNDAAKVRPV
ncbi:MAG: methyltransferase domain-containing protein [Zoogloeaceae bacterium]|jgi:malonyl-CoA O-methyltransferase|nr:methyltransferase domain-containing protein [Zoogloeaceae bacterium]